MHRALFVWSCKLQLIAQLRIDDGVTFLCPYKKVTKENVWGMR